MKRNLLQTLALGLALSGTAFQASALDETLLLDLTKNTTFQESLKFSPTYNYEGIWNWNSYSAGFYVYRYGVEPTAYDEYLLTPEVELQKNHLYEWRMRVGDYESRTDKSAFGVDLLVGQGDSCNTYTQVIAEIRDKGYVSSYGTAGIETYSFYVTESGTYRLGIHSKSTAAFYQNRVYDMGSALMPANPTNLTVTPDADGAARVTVNFTMPSATKSGGELTGDLTYNIYRAQTLADGTADSEPILKHTGTAAAGDVVEWIDEEALTGEVDYHVEVFNEEGTTDRISAHVFVGREIPVPVSNLTLTAEGTTLTLAWSPVTTGTHGLTLKPEEVSYKIVRNVDGVETELETAYTDTIYTETLTFSDLTRVNYAVTTNYGELTAGPVASETVTLGEINLPFRDSFAKDGQPSLSKYWAGIECVNNTSSQEYVWEVRHESKNNPYATPQDGDGGLLYYNSYSAKAQSSSRIFTAPITKESSTHPVVQFWFYHYTSGSETLTLQVKPDNGEWTDVCEPIVLAADLKEWKKYNVSLPDSIINACDSTYSIGFLAVSNWGYDMAIDNVSVFNLAENDLAASTLTASSDLKAGATTTFSFIVANNSSNDVAAEDYTLKLNTDFPGEIQLPATQPIPSLSDVKFSFEVPVDAMQAAGAEKYNFQVEVAYANSEITDEDLSNNASDTLSVATGFIDSATYPSPAGLIAEMAEDKSVALSWTPLLDPDYTPYSLKESFEGLDDNSEDLHGFTVIDRDSVAGETYYIASGSKFHIATATEGHPASGVDGEKLLAVTYNKTDGVVQDDWIITPLITALPTNSLRVSYKIGFKAMSGYSDYYRYEVLYSTEEYDPANPAAAFTNTIYSDNYVRTNYGEFGYEKMVDKSHQIAWSGEPIPGNTKYIAIHLKTQIALNTAVFVDDIRVEEVTTLPLQGYNVYEDGKCLNDTVLPYTVTSFTAPAPEADETADPEVADPLRTFTVSAVYPDGESAPSIVATTDTVVDMALKTIEAPEYALAGEEYTVKVHAKNLGNVEAANFDIALFRGETEVSRITEEGSVASGETKEYTFGVTMAAEDAEHKYTARVFHAGDLKAENDVTEEATVTRTVSDLAISGLTAPATVNAGEPFELKATVTNTGNTAFAADSYVVKLYRDDEEITVSETPELAAGASAEITFPEQTISVLQNSTPKFHAEVVLAEGTDETAANNTTEEVTVTMNPVELEAPAELTVTKEENSVLLSWRAPLLALPGAAELHLLGYNIYRNDEKIATAEDPWPYNAWTESEELPDGSYIYKVTAVYNIGESEASNEATIEYTGLDGIYAGNVRVEAADGHIAIIGADGQQARIFTASGIMLYEGLAEKAVERTFEAGVYVVAVPAASFKVQLR